MTPRILFLFALASAPIASCSPPASAELAPPDARITYVSDGGDEGGGALADGQAFEATPASCSLIGVVVGASQGCRADWTCANSGLYTFVCGAAGDGGLSSCYCIGGADALAAGPIDACNAGQDAVEAAAAAACNWTFAIPSSDGGGQ